MQARAKMNTHKATGPETIAPPNGQEASMDEPEGDLAGVSGSIFQNITVPRAWKEIVIAPMPREAHVDTLPQTRALCVVNTFANWHMMSLMVLAETE
eukprot:6657620-Pyramimonas_sp.AAC.1